MVDMATDDLTPLKMFSQQQQDLYNEPQTISLADADLASESQTPEPSYSSGSPAPTLPGDDDDKKPTKKRKSWGQELPVPKTNLPPRKRAKTEDEKEQRRIERVLRNRAAAQSSRERKRQEVEKLEGEKKTIEEENLALRQRVMTVEDEKYRLEQTIRQLVARIGQTTVDAIAPGPVSPEHDFFHIKTEPTDQHNGLPSPNPSRQGSASRSRSASLQSPTMAPPLQIQTTAQPVRHVPAPLDLSHRPAVSVTDGLGYDARDSSVSDNMGVNADQVPDGQSTTEDLSFAMMNGAITINVNGETVDMINDAELMNQMATVLPTEQEQQSISNTFDALLQDMSPQAPTSSEFTPSPELPSLSFFEDMSAGSPNSTVPSPDFGAVSGDLILDFCLDGSAMKHDGKMLFDEPLFPINNDILELGSFAQSTDFTT